MKRWKKVTIWVASILVILVVGGLFAADYAVDKVLNSMVGMSVDDLIEDGEGAAPNNSEGAGDATSVDAGTDTDAVAVDADEPASDPGSKSNESVSDSGNNSVKPVSNDNNGAANGGGQSGSAGGGTDTADKDQSDSGSSKGSGGYSAEISTDKAKEVEENITVAEKAKVVTTLMSSLSASDISTLQKLASGGLTLEEKREARTILLEKLTEDQYNELIAIAAKHGLSQGRSYSEVKDE